MPKTCKFRCEALVHVPVLVCVVCVYMWMESLQRCRMGRGQTSNIDLNSLDHIEVLRWCIFITLWQLFRWDDSTTTQRRARCLIRLQLGHSAGSQNKGQTKLVLQGGSENADEPAISLAPLILIPMVTGTIAVHIKS